MAGTTTLMATACREFGDGRGRARGEEVELIAQAYLARAHSDPYRALAAAIADALADLDAAEAVRGRTVSAGYVRARPSGPDRP